MDEVFLCIEHDSSMINIINCEVAVALQLQQTLERIDFSFKLFFK